MRAIKSQAEKKATLVTDAPVPTLLPDYILVKVSAVALNPTDWKVYLHFCLPLISVNLVLSTSTSCLMKVLLWDAIMQELSRKSAQR